MAAFRGSFARNFAWLVGSEGVVRATRLVTAVVLARYLSATEFGIAAIAMASHEMLRLLAQNGFGLRLIRAKDDDVDALCNTLYVLNWGWSICLFAVQCGAGWLVARYYGLNDVWLMLGVLAGVYLTMPLGLTQMYRVQREQKLKVTAWVDSTQVMLDNVLTAALAVAGLGAWAIVLPKLIVAPIWVVGYRMACDWRFDRTKGFWRFADAFSETRGLLSAEVARGLRSQMDIFVIGRLLGTEALGLYYFARNSGLGISLALLQAATHAMLPKLGEVVRQFGVGARLQSESLRILRLLLLVTLPIIAAQALLAPWYVPMVFGEQWTPAVPVLVLLCLSAVPRLVGESMTQLARVAGRAADDARWNIWSAPLFLATMIVGCHYGLVATALSVFLFHMAYQSAFVLATGTRLFKRQSPATAALQAHS
ncbi:MAG: oligosaccharide flippase family protein [Pseudomonadota bacterium]